MASQDDPSIPQRVAAELVAGSAILCMAADLMEARSTYPVAIVELAQARLVDCAQAILRHAADMIEEGVAATVASD
jgi:hypothetical protein